MGVGQDPAPLPVDDEAGARIAAARILDEGVIDVGADLDRIAAGVGEDDLLVRLGRGGARHDGEAEARDEGRRARPIHPRSCRRRHGSGPGHVFPG